MARYCSVSPRVRYARLAARSTASRRSAAPSSASTVNPHVDTATVLVLPDPRVGGKPPRGLRAARSGLGLGPQPAGERGVERARGQAPGPVPRTAAGAVEASLAAESEQILDGDDREPGR